MNDKQYMDNPAFRVAYLVKMFAEESITQDEQKELDDWINATTDNQRFFEELMEIANAFQSKD